MSDRRKSDRRDALALERLAALLREQGGLMASLVGTSADGGAVMEGAGRTSASPADSDGIGDGEDGIRNGMRSRATGGDGIAAVEDDIKNAETDSHGHTGIKAGIESVSGPAQLAASGPRAEGRRPEYELLVEAIYEGYLLHYGASRVVSPPEADLGLLAGDRLYALGLARLVELGDTEAVAELADTITLSALAQATGQPVLAEVVWTAGARAVGWGSSAAHRRAKQLAFAGAPEAIEAMRTSAAGPPASP